MGVLPRFLADARVATVARIAIGALFIYAASSKFDPLKFAQEVNNYRLLPAPLVNLVAVALPFAELLAGIMLVVGLRVRAGALAVVGMLCGFIFAMSYVWAKGIDIECGCFGKGTKVGFRAISEDVGMMLLAIEAYAFDRGRFGLDGLIARLRERHPAGW
ncbi:MAG: DoxX family membrane protein [Deltaproteobacteria bacterium]|nr:DoxX family membrane protein [Deltaproteobacteria bacterium]